MLETTCEYFVGRYSLSLSDNGIISFFLRAVSLVRILDLIDYLVDLGLVEALDDVGAVKEATPGCVGAAQRLAPLDDAVVAGEAALGDTAEG
jgi:hypothetical protein